MRAALECEQATEKFVATGDARADVRTFLERDGREPQRRRRPDHARLPRHHAVRPRGRRRVPRDDDRPACTSTCAALLAAELGDDFPDLDLRATAGPAILVYQAAICGQPMDAEAMADRLTELLFAPLPVELAQPS